MKKSLIEELHRIHELTYGKKILVEDNLLDKALNKITGKKDDTKIDDPKKADLVSPDVKEFYDTLKKSADDGGISQQESGSMTFQKEVESMQIGLVMLGYELPKHGVDGLFGPETAAAVEKFKLDNNIKDGVNESADDIRQIAIGQHGWKEKSGQLSGGGEISSDLSKIVNELIDEWNQKNPQCKGTFTSGNDVFHHNITSYTSLHTKGLAVDIVLPSSCHSEFIELLKKYKSKYDGFSFIDEYRNPTKMSTGGHFHVSYRKGKPEGGGNSPSLSKSKATPEMLNKLIELLKNKGVTSEELKKYLDQSSSSSNFVIGGDVDSNWMSITEKVIDKFEGGYWNYWECKNHPYAKIYDNSGETLFGLDRKAGKIENISPDGSEFFRLIDEEKKKLGMDRFCQVWKYNYRGGELEGKLKQLAAKVMKKIYDQNMRNYVKNNEVRKRIEGNSGLLLHMSYACWNGPGFFRKFANKIEEGVNNGLSDEELIDLVTKQRKQLVGGDWSKATAKVNNTIRQISNIS